MKSYDQIATEIYAMDPTQLLFYTAEGDNYSQTIDLASRTQTILSGDSTVRLVSVFDSKKTLFIRQQYAITAKSLRELYDKEISATEKVFPFVAEQMKSPNKAHLICFLVGERINSQWERGVMVSVDADIWAKSLLSELDEVYILDSDNNIFLSNNPELIGQQVPDYSEITQNIEINDGVGSDVCKINKQKYLISIVSQNSNGYKIILVQPMNKLLRRLDDGLWQLLIMTVVILGVAGIASLIISSYLSLPINGLLSKITNMALNLSAETESKKIVSVQAANIVLQKVISAIDDMKQSERQSQQVQYLTGLLPDEDSEVLFPTQSGWFLAVLQWDEIEVLSSSDIISVVTSSVSDILQKTYGLQECTVLPVENQIIALICSDTDGKIEKILPDLQSVLSSVSGYSISISISSKNEKGTLAQRYQKACFRMNAKALRGSGVILTYDEEVKMKKKKLPSLLVDKILSCVRNNDIQSLSTLVQQLLNEMRYCHYDFTLHQIADLCMQAFYSDRTNISKSAVLWGEVYRELLRCSTSGKMENILVEYLIQASTQASKSYKQETMDVALTYIHEHYKEESISMSSVADFLHMNPSHFSREFKKVMEESFPSFINRLRLDFAYHRLLEDPTQTVEKIAQQCGFYSSSYFTSVFSKKYGVSPSQVRKRDLIQSVAENEAIFK